MARNAHHRWSELLGRVECELRWLSDLVPHREPSPADRASLIQIRRLVSDMRRRDQQECDAASREKSSPWRDAG